MEAITENKKRVHQGRNIRIARNFRNMTQETLAFKVDLSQSRVSDLELKEEIEDELLDKFASALDVPVGFLKSFEPEAAMNVYNQQDSKIEVNGAENSKDIILQQGEQYITTNNYPIGDIKELYERLLKEKDQQIEELKSRAK
ncbi:MAG: helix-turn-helix domain-containing protein [Prevotella sp.]|jgi:transcriptional regulator with XRE-family HTH domain|nr:helix-turn-helix domain-containing protein [Prevotella sp.]